jgi:hypothetical protein
VSVRHNRTVVWGRQVLVGLAIVFGAVVVAGQGITIPNTFTNFTTADANQVNANFAALASNALNRNGGTMLGTLSSQAVAPTTDNTYDFGSSTFAFRDAYVKRNTILNTVSYTWPGSQGPAGSLLQNNGSGTLSWATGGWTPVTTTSTGTQNDFAPGLSGNTIVRCNNATLLTITGLAGGVDGQHVKFESIGAGQVDFAPQNTGSTAANRQINFAGSSGTLAPTSLAAGSGFAEVVYDGTSARWRLTQHEQGAWITPTYAGANYTAQTGTWTVDSADVTTQAYYLKGRTLTVAFNFVTTSVSATPTSLNILNPAWGGFTSAKAIIGAQVYSDNSAAFAMGYVATLGTVLTVNKITGTWAIATNTTSANGQITFEVQ